MDLKEEARRIASEYGIDPDLFVKLVQAESSFDPDIVGEAGEVGLTQIMENTALDPGYDVKPIENRRDPLENLRFGAEYYKAMKDKFGSDEFALMAYNTGPGNAEAIINLEKTLPPSTEKYIKTILGRDVDPDNKWGIRRREVTTVDPNEMGASGTDLAALLNSQYGALGGTSAKTQEADPALASLLYFSKMGELASQPGSTALGSAVSATMAPAEYLADLKKPLVGTPGSNVAKVLAQWDNGLVQYLTRDGTMVVKFLNKVYTDPTQIKQLIDEAELNSRRVDLATGKVEAEIAGLGEGKKEAYKIAAKKSGEASTAIVQLQDNIKNYKEGILAIDEGAKSGFFMQYLPNWSEASKKLDNVVKRLGLDVIGSTTFGALSAGELAMAMSTAAPISMAPQYLKKWFEERIKAKENVLKIQQDMVRFFGAGDKTLKDYYDRADRLVQEGNWRSTLGLEDVDENYADGMPPPDEADATSVEVDEITSEDQETIAKINTMTRDELNALDERSLSIPVLEAWIARSAQLNELEK